MKKILFFCVFPILIIFFLLHYWLVGQAVYGDARYYWYFSRSLIIDHDLNLDNEANHRYDHLGNNVFKFQNSQPITPLGDLKDEFHQPIGTSIAWLPFFIIGDFFAHSLNLFGFPVLANGYSDVYQIIVGFGAIFLVVLGLYICYKLAKNFFSARASGIATLTLLFATNLFYYSSLDVVNSHAISFFLSSVFFYLWYKTLKNRTVLQWFLLGLIVGFLAETRTQDAIFSIVLVLEIIWKIIGFYKSHNRKSLQFLTQNLFFLVIFGIGFLIFMTPQILVWKTIYGGFFSVPYLMHPEPFTLLNPHFLGVLINMKTGIIPYSPIIIPAVFGLYFIRKKSNMIAVIFLIFFSTEYFIISSWGAWDQASSYGIRMLISTMPVLIIGCGLVIEKLIKTWSQKVVIGICTVFILFNFFMIGFFHLFLKEVTYDGGKPTRIEAVEKINKLFHTNLKLFQ